MSAVVRSCLPKQLNIRWALVLTICSRCGFFVKTRIGANLVCGDPGVAPKGDETDEKLPMNPEVAEVDVSQSVGASQTTYAKPHEYTLRECCPNTKQCPFTPLPPRKPMVLTMIGGSYLYL